MNSDIAYLQLLEDDLREAAQFERELDEEARARAAHGTTPTGPRRLPRRGMNWSRVAAVFVAFIVVAGGIGFLSQRGSVNGSRSVAGAASGTTAPDQHNLQELPAPAASGAPAPRAQFAFGADAQSGDIAAHITAGAASGNSSGTGGNLVAAQPQGDLSKIERDGQIGILLANGQFTDGVGQVTHIAVANKGMVLSSSSQNDQSGTFTLRIPVAHFDRVMGALRGIAPDAILYQDATGKDVTADFIDYHARLTILKKQRDLLVGLQSKATEAGQILFYADKINATQLNIETIQGDLNFLNDSVAQSTIKVELREKDAPQGTTPDNVNNPSLRSAWHHSEQGFLRILGAVVIGLGYLIPIAIIALLVWGVVMLVRRRRPAAS